MQGLPAQRPVEGGSSASTASDTKAKAQPSKTQLGGSAASTALGAKARVQPSKASSASKSFQASPTVVTPRNAKDDLPSRPPQDDLRDLETMEPSLPDDTFKTAANPPGASMEGSLLCRPS